MDEIETLGKMNSTQRWHRVSALGLCLGALAAPALAQTPPNLLTNAGFEDNPLPGLVCGNNYPKPITPWVMLSGSQTNVVAVDGGANCNYGNSGPALDAQNTPQGTWQHYLDLLATGTVYQTFTVPSCPGGGAAPAPPVSRATSRAAMAAALVQGASPSCPVQAQAARSWLRPAQRLALSATSRGHQ